MLCTRRHRRICAGCRYTCMGHFSTGVSGPLFSRALKSGSRPSSTAALARRSFGRNIDSIDAVHYITDLDDQRISDAALGLLLGDSVD
jgi:hypothetical protein